MKKTIFTFVVVSLFSFSTFAGIMPADAQKVKDAILLLQENCDLPYSYECNSTRVDVANLVKNLPAPVPAKAKKKRVPFAKRAAAHEWVKNEINIAIDNSSSSAALTKQLARITALENRVKKNEKGIKQNKNDIGTIATTQRKIQSDAKELKGEVKKNTDAINSLGNQIDLEVGGLFFAAPHILGFGVMGGVQLGITDSVDLILDVGLGYSLNREAVISTKGGLLFYTSDNFGVGFSGLFLKEEFNDTGTAEIGGVLDLRYRTGRGFFAAGFIGFGAEGMMIEHHQVLSSGLVVNERVWAPAIFGGVHIGWEFL